ncbi:PqqD family protein [Paenibacillus sp. MBLB4367]|uniref:PqqD family protein n=1 Tax=Paenibacillus sp. MBLB4367 TaxID=3384767 RepID=UPI00390837A0
MNMTSVYKRTTQIEAVEVGEEWIVMHTAKLTVTKMNEVGGFIWSELKESSDVASLVRKLQERYDISEEIALRDVQLFLAELEIAELIEHAS